ncbi:MAG: glycine betaine ABC transporter substrate-binding protein, partial [Pseudomonadota bacterium]
MRRAAAALALVLLLAGCGAEPVVIGARDTAENRILARMLEILLEERGVTARVRPPMGDTARVFAALRRGDIDVYPEYTGAALGLMGLPASPDAEAAFAATAEGFEPLGLWMLAPLGFEAGFAVMATAGTVTRLELSAVEDLAGPAPELRLGVTRAFAARPAGGLQAFLDRFGLVFEAVEVVEGTGRAALYDRLIEGELDVAVGMATDPQIAAFSLETLRAPGDFFPAWGAAYLARDAAIGREPALAAAARALAGRLDAKRMRALNARVALEGRSAEAVARAALAELGLIEPGAGEPEAPPLALAVRPAARGSDATNRALRALRAASEGRGVEVVAAERPLAAQQAQRARLALAPAIAHYEISGRRATLRPGIEAVAVVGSVVAHA